MLNIYDPLFILEDNDLLSVEEDGPLNPLNIENTINNMAINIANSMGYTKCTSFGIDSYTLLDNIYNNNNSIAIPIFNELNEEENGEKILRNKLTDSNVSFLILTSKSGIITKNENDNYSSTSIEGNIYDDLNLIGKTKCDRLINLRFYRYINQDNDYKFDFYPIILDIIRPVYYGYKNIDNNEEVQLCIGELCNFLLKQQVAEFNIRYDFPLYPTNNDKYLSNKIYPINKNDTNIDYVNSDLNPLDIIRYCHIFNKFYLFSEEEVI